VPRSRETRAAGKRRIATGVALAAVSAIAVIQVAGAAPGERRPITGTDRGETIFGTRHADTIRGRGGDDRIVARARGDRVFGGRGYDTIRGGRGGDELIGGPGGALMIGSSGRDGFNFRAGAAAAGGGDDVIRARDGRPDEINCGAGADVAYVDRVEDGVYDCERVVMPGGVVVDR
jgi:Ca2+-binding RTX toxin-like protein